MAVEKMDYELHCDGYKVTFSAQSLDDAAEQGKRAARSIWNIRHPSETYGSMSRAEFDDVIKLGHADVLGAPANLGTTR